MGGQPPIFYSGRQAWRRRRSFTVSGLRGKESSGWGVQRQFSIKRAKKCCSRAEKITSILSYRQYLADLLVFHVREQLYRTQTSLAAELVQGAAQLEVPFRVVLFDDWFLHNELIDPIEALGKGWVGGCPKDRLILFNNRWIELQEYLRTIPASAYRPTQVFGQNYWAFTKVLTFKSLNRRRLRMLASYDNPDLKGDPFSLVTNRKDWERTRILLTYHDRWPTETFNEDINGDLGFEDYQLHKLRGIRPHWYLCLAAYSLLGEQGYPGRSRQGVQAPFESTGQRCRAVVDETLGHLVGWLFCVGKVRFIPICGSGVALFATVQPFHRKSRG